MQTLKDIKNVLNNIPDESLELLHFGLGEDAEEDISLIAEEESDIGFPEVFDKYPKLMEIDNLIRNIVKAQSILDKQDYKAEGLTNKLTEEGITDKFFEDKKKPSSFQPKEN